MISGKPDSFRKFGRISLLFVGRRGKERPGPDRKRVALSSRGGNVSGNTAGEKKPDNLLRSLQEAQARDGRVTPEALRLRECAGGAGQAPNRAG